jgi:hypothetical protein
MMKLHKVMVLNLLPGMKRGEAPFKNLLPLPFEGERDKG